MFKTRDITHTQYADKSKICGLVSRTSWGNMRRAGSTSGLYGSPIPTLIRSSSSLRQYIDEIYSRGHMTMYFVN